MRRVVAVGWIQAEDVRLGAWEAPAKRSCSYILALVEADRRWSPLGAIFGLAGLQGNHDRFENGQHG